MYEVQDVKPAYQGAKFIRIVKLIRIYAYIRIKYNYI